MKITRFEDLQCWQEARILVNMVYEAIRNNPNFQKDFRLSNQITGAAISSMSNIAEGFSRRSNKEFTQYLFISKSSATEVQSETYVASDQNIFRKRFLKRFIIKRRRYPNLIAGL